MRRRPQGQEGTPPEQQDMQGVSGAQGSGQGPQSSTSATGATSTGRHGSDTTYEQGGYQQGGQMQTTTGYGRGQAAAEDYDSSGYYGRPTPSRHGAALAILAGSLAFLEGLAFVIRSHYYHATLAGYAYRWNLHGWGWVLLILGALLFAAGMSHLLRIKGSGRVAAALAVITAVVAFITIFYSVIWGIVVLAACGFAAYALLSHEGEEGYGAGGAGSAGYGGASYQGTSQRGTGDDAMVSQGGPSRRS